jgi:hypothetical protein
MELKVLLKNIIAIGALGVAFVSMVATSKSRRTVVIPPIDSRLEGHVDQIFEAKINGDCSGASVDSMDIRVQNFKIVEPKGKSFVDFGFPNELVDGSNSVGGTIDGRPRFCDPIIGGPQFENEWAYSCADEGSPVCSIKISFTHQIPPPLPAENKTDL